MTDASHAPAFSLDRVLADIDEEVHRRRAAGDFPPSLERELDLTFDRFAPVGNTDGDFADALSAADRASYVNAAVPVESQKPLVTYVKRLLRKMMAWYITYLAQQVTVLGTASVKALRALAERVTVVEEQTAALRPPVDDGTDRPAVAADLSEWTDLVVARLKGTKGRVLHAECGDGSLLRALVDAGVDAYGVDPRGPLGDAAVASGLDAWPDDPVAHLKAVGDGTLAGLVLSGCLDRLPVGAQRQLIELAGQKLALGGVLVLLGANPESWHRAVPHLEADLAPGRPLHATTWEHLLARARFGEVESVPSSSAEGGLRRVPGRSEAAGVMNANLDRINEALFAPPGYAVVGVRGS